MAKRTKAGNLKKSSFSPPNKSVYFVPCLASAFLPEFIHPLSFKSRIGLRINDELSIQIALTLTLLPISHFFCLQSNATHFVTAFQHLPTSSSRSLWCRCKLCCTRKLRHIYTDTSLQTKWRFIIQIFMVNLRSGRQKVIWKVENQSICRF